MSSLRQTAGATRETQTPALACGTTNHWAILLGAAAVMGLSALLSLGEHQSEVMVPLVGIPLPPVCAMKLYTGLDCPGCGLTRSFIATAHGQWSEALRFNPAGPIWFALIAVQIPWQAAQLWRIRRGRRPFELGWWGQGMLYAALAALIVQWSLRQWGAF